MRYLLLKGPLSANHGFYGTIEGCCLSKCDRHTLRAGERAYSALSHDARRPLLFSPENGEFIERATYWRELFRPAMTPQQLHKAMMCILDWYGHIKRMRKIQQ